MERPVVKTKQGSVLGLIEGRFLSFRGIPYGTAERFRAGKPYQWEGILDCAEFGKMAPQIPEQSASCGESQKEDDFGEDCLNLNVYTPDLEGNLPVLVDIHGGSFQYGSNRGRTPEKVIEDKEFVYVNINYRLGAFGYLYLGDILGKEYQTSGNNALMDQLLALRWVHENISAFGGDPERVTLMGLSAGAKSISTLMMLPGSRSYFSQVILSSGAYQCVRDKETAGEVARRYMELLPIDKPSEILSISTDKLLAAQKKLCLRGRETCVFGPVADGEMIPYDWENVLNSKQYWSGKAIVGSCRNEMGVYKFREPDFASQAQAIAEGLFGMNAKIAEEDFLDMCKKASCHGADISEEKKVELWTKILSDYMYRTYSTRLADILEKNGSTVYKYSMEQAPAFHCNDQTLAFEMKDGVITFADEESREERIHLGHTIFMAYTNFVLTGDPNGPGVPQWSQYRKGEGLRMRWDTESKEEREPEEDVLQRFPQQVYRLK